MTEPGPQVNDWSTTTVRHGTNSGWALHRKLGERPCDPCYRAKSENDKRWRAAPEQTRKHRARARAQAMANGRMKAAHPDEYARFYAEAKAELFADEENG